MTNKKRTAYQKELSGRTFKILRTVFATLNLPFSDRYNATYGVADALEIIITMCANSRCASAARRMLAAGGTRVPTSQWLLGIIGISHHEGEVPSNAGTDADRQGPCGCLQEAACLQ